jgi:hypothetical protein
VFVNTAPDGEALTAVIKSIQLLTTLLAGNSDTAAEFRDQTLASEEDFSHLVDIFAIMQRAAVEILGNEDSCILLEERWGESVSLVETALVSALRLWVTVCAHRDALSEEKTRLSRDNSEPAPVASSEMQEALEWVTVHLIPALRSNASAQRSRLADAILASVLSPITDALLTGISSQHILVAVESWSTFLTSTVSCCNVSLANEGIVRCPVVHCIPSLARLANVLSMEAARFESADDREVLAFQSEVHKTWLSLVDVIVAHAAPHKLVDNDDDSNVEELELQTNAADAAKQCIASSIGKTANARLSFAETKTSLNGRKAERSKLLLKKCLDMAIQGASLKPSVFKNLEVFSGAEVASKRGAAVTASVFQSMLESRDIDDWVEWKAAHPLGRPCFDILLKKLSSPLQRDDFLATLWAMLSSSLTSGVTLTSATSAAAEASSTSMTAAVFMKFITCHFNPGSKEGGGGVGLPDAVTSTLSFLERSLDKENSAGSNASKADLASDRQCTAIAALLQL